MLVKAEKLRNYDHFYTRVAKENRSQQGISIIIYRLKIYITTEKAIGERSELIILRDLNTRVGKKRTNEKIVGRYGEETINNYKQKLTDEWDQNQLFQLFSTQVDIHGDKKQDAYRR